MYNTFACLLDVEKMFLHPCLFPSLVRSYINPKMEDINKHAYALMMSISYLLMIFDIDDGVSLH